MKLDCMGQRSFSNERMEARICKPEPKTMVSIPDMGSAKPGTSRIGKRGGLYAAIV